MVVLQEFLRGAIPGGADRGQKLVDDGRETPTDERVGVAAPFGYGPQVLLAKLGDSGSGERIRAGRQSVEENPQGIQVGPRVERPADPLLRRDVRGRADDLALVLVLPVLLQ